jgi:ABC-type transport system involved in cytochrome bd biosynthesis fused ATPase/permease subunit
MMEQNQHQQRRAANQEFEKSLNQLEGMLHESLTENEEIQTEEITDEELMNELTDIDLAAFEDAVADIEQYLEEKTK